tara:strand:+ start:434 stop:1912 length:1479 start_codon:yes stop_codon:yes gene_type:complete
MLKQSLIKNLLERRIPHILGSYLVAGTSLVLFIEYLVDKYQFPSHYPTLFLFALVGILPSVIILAYFHGAPGKDEWTKIEKIGIPMNILFIAIFLFFGYRFNLWQEGAPDHSKVYDTFLIHIESNKQESDNLKSTSGYIDEADLYTDSLYYLEKRKLEDIREYVNVALKKEFMYHNLDIYYSETKEEDKILDKSTSSNYTWELFDKRSKTENKNQYDSTLTLVDQNHKNIFKYFSEKNDKHIDFLIKISIYEANPNSKTKILLMDMSDDYTIYAVEIMQIKHNYSEDDNIIIGGYHINSELEMLASNDQDETLEDLVLNMLIDKLSSYSFGRNIGEVDSILDSNLVTIKLTNFDVIKGSNLICRSRAYEYSGDNPEIARKALNRYVDDGMMIYRYFVENPDKVVLLNERLDFDLPSRMLDNYIDDFKEEIDSKRLQIDHYIDNLGGKYSIAYEHFTYYLKILNIQDSIATAKITGSVFPFAYPKIGDEINVK